ncbi:acyltransferase [Demequina sp. NBRC 110053]|uniref:acyltransferase n=1 Tax=Demequina sp. NBRC 110053 TaxID=1570342 RepID=UPI000A06BBFD|nr:acyltransferase [Demequina sp. NBRC 110053]
MGTTLTSLAAYSDDDGNSVEYAGAKAHGAISILFAGGNNSLIVHPEARLQKLSVRFDCNNAVLTIGANTNGRDLMLGLRLGEDASITIGDNVTTTNTVIMSAVEGASITIGRDTMIASGCQVRTDDGHPIFDVHSGRRVNVARDITVGEHVWLGGESVLLGGASIGSGSVIGYRAIVTRSIPNNVVAAGIPAKVIRKHIAWERPHLSLAKPYYKPDASTVKKSKRYWAPTREEHGRPSLRQRLSRRLRRARGGAPT